ncbi:IclR family transcriptional regulator [Bacillus sp. FJAT-27251]|uniref:IclR family transcriptional regulator n=1 Tax=Bacillus sp. FJAT-27251 TaxID=1684142 RepID=UPI000A51002A
MVPITERLIQSIERAADVLELFLSSDQYLSVKEISDRLGLSKSTVHGIIKTLEFRGYLKQNPADQKYKLGMKLFELGNQVSQQINIAEIARPVIKELVQSMQETVHLVVYENGEVIYVEKLDGPRALRIYSHIGKRAPIHCTGVGKAILAHLDDAKVEELLSNDDLKPFTEHTMTDKQQVKQQLESIRERGYAVDDEEIELGLQCVAAPIFDHKGKAVAAISCAAPKMRLDQEKLNLAIIQIKGAASRISASLGYKA